LPQGARIAASAAPTGNSARASPTPHVFHRHPRFARWQRFSRLQQLDRHQIRRAHEGHAAVAGRAVDGDAVRLQALAGGVDVVHSKSQVAKVARVCGSGGSRERSCLKAPASRLPPLPQAIRRVPHQLPTFSIDTQGSQGGNASPACNNSIDTRSGERTKAMRPSRGGRLMVTPCACKRSQAV